MNHQITNNAVAQLDPYARLRAYAKAGARIRIGGGHFVKGVEGPWSELAHDYDIHPDDLCLCPEYAQAAEPEPISPADAEIARLKAELEKVNGFLENDVFRHRQEREELQNKLANAQAEHREVSDAYLRIRELLNAFDTDFGGANRFEVTEKKLRDLIAKAAG